MSHFLIGIGTGVLCTAFLILALSADRVPVWTALLVCVVFAVGMLVAVAFRWLADNP